LHRAPRLQKLFSSSGHINSPTQTLNSSNLEKVVPRVGSIILCQIIKGTPCAGEYASLTQTQEHVKQGATKIFFGLSLSKTLGLGMFPRRPPIKLNKHTRKLEPGLSL